MAAWKAVARPYYCPGNIPTRGPWSALQAGSGCPPSLQNVLAANGLAIDDATARDGNCGTSAFVLSIGAQVKGQKIRAGPEAAERRRQSLRRCPPGQQVSHARDAGIEWLGHNSRAKLWQGMIIANLVQAVADEDFPTYVQRMRRSGEWVDTAFLHALGCAYGVTVLVFQDGMEPAILGPHLHDDFDGECDIIVPVALVNDYHFWAVVPFAEPGGAVVPWVVDKGELPPFQTTSESGGAGPSAAKARGRQNTQEADDGDEIPKPWTSKQLVRSPSEIDAEVHLCVALSRWCPWSAPSDEIVQAIGGVASSEHTVADGPARCLSRRHAMEALAYEAVHFKELPEILRYHRGARRHLINPKEWQRSVCARENTRKYILACSKVIGVDALASEMEQWECVRDSGRAHSSICVGVRTVSPAVIHNWRVLWYSMPATTRKELVLRAYADNLQDHRARGGADETWRMRYSFMGLAVCKVAWLTLTGMSAHMIVAAREGALAGRRSFLSVSEMGIRASIKNTSKWTAYLSARQWLERYASTHAEMSPMDEKAYLPSGRKIYYYYHYRRDMLERHGGQQCSGDGPSESSGLGRTPRPGDKRSYGDGPGESSGLGRTPRPGEQSGLCASLAVFLEAWRVECPWIVVLKSIGMFSRCSVCEYLKMLIEKTPRDQEEVRGHLKDRLGQHFDFQAAQRLALGREEEDAAQSEGSHWCTLVDKMDQRKSVVPSVWSQLSTPLFKDVDRRLVTGLIGSMWFGTLQTTHRLRTLFDDCMHGAEMQSSSLMWDLHQVAMDEGHLPRRWSVCADNTRKETKNQYTMWFFVWLLCALCDTSLATIDVLFLLVGHTHNKLDRFFSRLAVALAGRDYFTVVGMIRLLQESLKYCRVESGHLSQVWGFKELMAHRCTATMHNLDPVHAFRFSRSGGIYMQWKQWATDLEWSKPVQLVSRDDVPLLAAFRPSCLSMTFSDGTNMLAWIERFEYWCASQPVGEYKTLGPEFNWLRGIIHHTVPGVYAPGTQLDSLLADLRGLAAHRPTGPSPQSTLPMDSITQLFPGADIGSIPTDVLVRIDGITHSKGTRRVLRSNAIYSGSFVVVKAPPDTVVLGHAVPFLVGVAVETSSSMTRDGVLAVVWYTPALSEAQTFRSGTKKKMLDVFGTWSSVDGLSVQASRTCRFPSPVVKVCDILECNFELSSDGAVPYDVFDALRLVHGIDITCLSQSMTHKGNLYRNYVLHSGRV